MRLITRINCIWMMCLCCVPLVYAGSSNSREYNVQGALQCSSISTRPVNKVVVFLNGIQNSLDDAENSRALLEAGLKAKGVCNTSNCVVQKFYNKEDGFIDDYQELNLVGDFNRDSADFALRQLYGDILIDSNKNRLLIENNQNIPQKQKDIYATNDAKVRVELDKLYDEAENSNTDPQVVFSKSGVVVTNWLIKTLMESTKIESEDDSIFLTTMRRNELAFDLRFKEYYVSMLAPIYLSKRDFYSSEAKAAAAITRTVEGLVTYLEEHMLSGKKVVVVAHSQGNHIIEMAHAVLKQKWGDKAVEAIQVVGVGAVSSTSPSNTYLTWDRDSIVLTYYDISTDGDPLTGNFKVAEKSKQPSQKATTQGFGKGPKKGKRHGFGSAYFNASLMGYYDPKGRGNISDIKAMIDSGEAYSTRDWVAGLVKGSLSKAKAYTSNNVASNKFMTATLRWEKQGDNKKYDMDLYINENHEGVISWKQRIGKYGKLDRDDPSGNGPEHYYSGISCAEAAGKHWVFGAEQYSVNGGSSSGDYPVISHMALKLGNSVLQHKSYNIDSWPSGIQWGWGVRFGALKNNKLPYSISFKKRISN